MVRWIAGVVLGIVAMLFGALSPAHAAPTASATTTYAYDSHHYSAVWTHATTQRGPSATNDQNITYDTVRHRPHGSLARLRTTATYGYNDWLQLVQVQSVGTTTQTQVLGPDGASSARASRRVAAKSGGALVKYDAGFAIGQLTKGGRGTASGLVDLAESQGWKAVQSSSGPLKYFDSNGIERLVIKRGSARTPGSDFPHVAIRNASGQRVDPYGNLVSRNSPGNHTPIAWDLP